VIVDIAIQEPTGRLVDPGGGNAAENGGRDRHRSGDLALFRRALYQLSYPTVGPRLPEAHKPAESTRCRRPTPERT
jgi:hypothetical protein